MLSNIFRWRLVASALLLMFLTGPITSGAQTAPGVASPVQAQPFKAEELEQLAAPIALYPDALIAQIMMAATYPLEIVQADRWVKANKDLKGDAMTAALEKNTWDPSVKSLVNFPQVLDMMSTQLDWTTKFGDAVIASQRGVMDAVQRLRAKAKAAGNLESNSQQKVTVEPGPPPLVIGNTSEPQVQVISIESPDPQVVYVPTYNPAVVYGTWPYPTYPPPPPYYPPGYVAGSNLISFGAGMAVGAAWGYAWGHCDWGHNDVDVDVNRNANLNRNINRENYQANLQNRTGNAGGKGNFQHDPSHRKGVSYRDQATAQRLDRNTADAARARENFRGRADAGRQDIARGSPGGGAGRPNAITGGGAGRPSATPGGGTGNRPMQVSRSPSSGGAFNGVNSGGSAARASSNRGQASRAASPSVRSAPSAPRGGGGAPRGGGGGARGGRR